MNVITPNSLVADLFDSSTVIPRLTQLFDCTAIVIASRKEWNRSEVGITNGLK